jgi:AraC-like DNA-binding protein
MRPSFGEHILLSRNYPPSQALAPYISSFYVFEAALPDDFVLEDFLLSESPIARFLLAGDWHAKDKDGVWTTSGPAIFFGSNEVPKTVRVRGSFKVAGFAVRPSGWHSLFAESHRTYTDQMLPLQAVWGSIADTIMDDLKKAADDAAMVTAMDAGIHARLVQIGRYKPDPEMARFELIARTDSTRRVEDIAAAFSMSVRQMERRCMSTFGLSPKAVLRRSRFLDMAAAMRGFSSPSEGELAALRYFDQSHLTREFRRFTGMTPGAFEKVATPLQTASLKLREESKRTSPR